MDHTIRFEHYRIMTLIPIRHYEKHHRICKIIAPCLGKQRKIRTVLRKEIATVQCNAAKTDSVVSCERFILSDTATIQRLLFVDYTILKNNKVLQHVTIIDMGPQALKCVNHVTGNSFFMCADIFIVC